MSFSGTYIIDDPIKPNMTQEDADACRARFGRPYKKRLKKSPTPIIIIQSRIHEDGPTGFLLGNYPEGEEPRPKLTLPKEDK